MNRKIFITLAGIFFALLCCCISIISIFAYLYFSSQRNLTDLSASFKDENYKEEFSSQLSYTEGSITGQINLDRNTNFIQNDIFYSGVKASFQSSAITIFNYDYIKNKFSRYIKQNKEDEKWEKIGSDLNNLKQKTGNTLDIPYLSEVLPYMSRFKNSNNIMFNLFTDRKELNIKDESDFLEFYFTSMNGGELKVESLDDAGLIVVVENSKIKEISISVKNLKFKDDKKIYTGSFKYKLTDFGKQNIDKKLEEVKDIKIYEPK